MTAPRLTLDPYLDICPDFSDAAFQSTRDLMLAGAAQGTPITDAEAAAQMATGRMRLKPQLTQPLLLLKKRQINGRGCGC
ncbi:hypothetical protein B0H13DRAFT_2381680 [Mycena leptocephala]|nr:hypothetical protein B0H13DRAFT_2381680 [Mycena leptocephala]